MLLKKEDIIVDEDRQRKLFAIEAMHELQQGILARGLFHPLVVAKEGDKWRLVAGERRFKAISYLHEVGKSFSHNGKAVPKGQYPCVLFKHSTELELAEAEYEENALRQDLTWQERADALAHIHELKVALNPEQSTVATARELSKATGESVSTLRANIANAQLIKKYKGDPDVAGARSFKEAFNIASRKAEAHFAGEMARRLKAREALSSVHRLWIGRLEDVMPKKLSPKSVDLIIADPPYGVNAHKFGKQAHSLHLYDDSKEYGLWLAEEIILQAEVVCKTDAQIFMFCDIDNFHAIREFMRQNGWRIWRTPIIWHKGSSGHAPWASHGFRREYECLAWCVRGNASLEKLSPDIIKCDVREGHDHAAEKPFQLYAHLIRHAVPVGSTVLDPCCGGGSIFTAAFTTSTRGWGIEFDPASVSLAQERFEYAVAQTKKADPIISEPGSYLHGLTPEAALLKAQSGHVKEHERFRKGDKK